jgi:predicted RNA-binding protein with PUA-like domain
MSYWLFKSEPETFNIDDLAKKPNKTEHWDGVRNYQARNFIRDDIKKGDQGFFYHSSCKVPGIAGIFEVVKSGYPDYTAWDPASDHYDPTCSSDDPRWFMVDVRFVKKFDRIFTLDEIKNNPVLEKMAVARRGNRLSITPVTQNEWKTILKLA